MPYITKSQKIKPHSLPLFAWAMRHHHRPAESVRWTVDRQCRVVSFAREVRQ